MRALTRMAAAAALAGLAACGGAGGDARENAAGNQANAAAEANQPAGGKDEAGLPAGSQAAKAADPETSGTGPSATAASPSREIRALLVGRWVEGGNCNGATDIRDNGTFASRAAGEGRWDLSNEYLTLTGSRATVELAVQEIGRGTMTTIDPQGHIGHWTRC